MIVEVGVTTVVITAKAPTAAASTTLHQTMKLKSISASFEVTPAVGCIWVSSGQRLRLKSYSPAERKNWWRFILNARYPSIISVLCSSVRIYYFVSPSPPRSSLLAHTIPPPLPLLTGRCGLVWFGGCSDQPSITELYLTPPHRCLENPEIDKLLALHRTKLLTAPNFVACPLAALVTSHVDRLRVLEIDAKAIRTGAATDLFCSALERVSQLESLTLYRPRVKRLVRVLEAVSKIKTFRALGLNFRLYAFTDRDGDVVATAIATHTPNITSLNLEHFHCNKPAFTRMLERLTAVEDYDSIQSTLPIISDTAGDRNFFGRLRSLKVSTDESDLTPICQAIGWARNLRVCDLDGMDDSSIKALASALESKHQIEQLILKLGRGDNISVLPVLDAIRNHPNDSLSELQITVFV